MLSGCTRRLGNGSPSCRGRRFFFLLFFPGSVTSLRRDEESWRPRRSATVWLVVCVCQRDGGGGGRAGGGGEADPLPVPALSASRRLLFPRSWSLSFGFSVPGRRRWKASAAPCCSFMPHERGGGFGSCPRSKYSVLHFLVQSDLGEEGPVQRRLPLQPALLHLLSPPAIFSL